MSWDFECVYDDGAFTEGPVWDGSGMLFTDIPNSRILHYAIESDHTTTYLADTNGTNGIKLGPDGTLYACEMVGRRLVSYDGTDRTVLAETYEGDRLNSPNDLAIDETGHVWFTDPHYETYWEPDDKTLELEHRSIYRINPAEPGELTRVTYDTTNPNGLLLSPGDDELYVAQSDYDGALELRAYPVDGPGSVGDYSVLHDFSPYRAIDGMCLDTDGNIVATAGDETGGPGPYVYVFAPDGEILARHPSPDPKPTNCAFGGADLQTLYLTGSDGCLYRADTDRTGYLGAPSGT